MRLVFLLLILLLGGCATDAVKPVPPIKHDDVLQSFEGGASIRGHVSVRSKDGAMRSAAGNDVVLLPDMPNAQDSVFFLDQRTHVVARIGAEWRSLAKIAHVDASGKFTFDELPAGDYILMCAVFWQDGKARTGTVARMSARVSRNQSLNVTLNK